MRTAISLRLVETRHGALATWWDGDPSEGLVVLLHGLGGDHRQSLAFTPTAADLGPAWQRVAIDLRGHGGTAALGDDATLSFDAFTQDVADVIDSLPVRPASVVVVGMSFGAEIALQLAHRRPDLVDRLVLLRSARPLAFVPAFMTTAYEQLYSCLQMGSHGKQTFVQSAAYEAVLDASAYTASSMAGQFDRDRAQERAPVISAFVDLEGLEPHHIHEVRVPALVLSTANDPAHPLRCGEFLADALTGAQPLLVLPPKDLEPEAYTSALLAATRPFVAAVPASSSRS